ncbi:579f0695-987d-422b-bf37-9a4a4865a9c1 [Sclerotinia trifoliorum]|uniref:579f0695-987d-422b-bf37-9a4a4865a9c1 n=1 Tax=Sclerotinia trifoliorum TaxID=28548 RepID=A0A8H2ZR21_9HELO|nr:579f0695-987d-422b-bf37-9a4a4865a9c1 [Sclerotinia trifoliorum]
MATCGGMNRENEREEKGIKRDKKRKYKSSEETKPKTESGDDDFYSDEEENPQVSNLRPMNASRSKHGSNTFVKSDSDDDKQFKKAKFTVIKFPQRKVCAVVKPTSSLRQHEHERDLRKRLAELKTAIQNVSEDLGVIMRSDEVSTVDALHEQIGKRDKEISKLKDKIITTDALHKTMQEKDGIISELRDANGRLQRDFAQQADKVKAFEDWKSLMKSNLDPGASAKN